MRITDNKAVLRRFIDDVLVEGRLELLDGLIADDFEDHAAMPEQKPGVEGMREKVASIRAAIPDLAAEILQIVGEDDLVVVRLQLTGTHTGPLLGIAPTNKPIDVVEFHMWRFENGMGIEHWEGSDKLEFLQQLGFQVQPQGTAA